MVLSGCVTPTTPTTRAELCRADASIAEAVMRGRQDGKPYDLYAEEFRNFDSGASPAADSRARRIALLLLDQAFMSPVEGNQREQDRIVTAFAQGAFEGCMRSNL